MTTLNSGLLFQRKYESDVNAVRRFILANEGVSNLKFRELYRMTAKSCTFIQLVKVKQSDLYWNLNKWLLRENWRDISIDSDTDNLIEVNQKKQCPKCAKEVFHSYLYSFSWVKTCPIHGVKLTSACPDCGNPWNFKTRYSSNPCTTCGTKRPKHFKERRSQLREHSKKEVNVFDAFWGFTQLHRRFANVLFYDYAENGCSAGITIGSEEFPNLAVSMHSRNLGLFKKIGLSTHSLPEKYFDGISINIDQFKSMPSNNEFITCDYVIFAIHEIDEEIRVALRLSVKKNYEEMDNVYPDRIDDYNEKIISYRIWKIITDEVLTSTRSFSTWWMRIFGILGIPYPEAPPIIHLVYTSDFSQIIEPSNEFRKWMYKNYLVNLFIYIYKHTLLLKCILRGKSELRIKNLSEGRRYVWSPTYNSFRIRVAGNHGLRVLYQPHPPWAEILKSTNVLKVYNNTPYFESFDQAHESTHWKNSFGRSLKAKKVNNLYNCLVKDTLYHKMSKYLG